LVVGDTVLFESAVINEYIDETTPEPRLHPADPLERAKDRAWIEFISGALVMQSKMSLAGDEASTRRYASKVHDRLLSLEQQMSGPLWRGEVMSLVDTAVAPLLQRLLWCEELCVDIGALAGLDAVRAWQAALAARPSVARSAVPDIRELYVDYLIDKGSWLGSLAAS
jgi:glutathione S-transferase